MDTDRHPSEHPTRPISRRNILRVAAYAAVGAVAAACAKAVPGWTYAPLGPTPSSGPSASPTAVPTAVPTAAGQSPTTPGGASVTIDIETTEAAPLDFVPKEITVPAGAQVTVNYLNNSSIPHNINFFNGPDQNAPSLGKTQIVTGPNALESVTFTAPSQPGDYFGEMALIDNFPRSAHAIANTDIEVLAIDKTDLDKILIMDRELGYKLLWAFTKTLSKRLRETNEKMASFLAMTGGF